MDESLGGIANAISGVMKSAEKEYRKKQRKHMEQLKPEEFVSRMIEQLDPARLNTLCPYRIDEAVRIELSIYGAYALANDRPEMLTIRELSELDDNDVVGTVYVAMTHHSWNAPKKLKKLTQRKYEAAFQNQTLRHRYCDTWRAYRSALADAYDWVLENCDLIFSKDENIDGTVLNVRTMVDTMYASFELVRDLQPAMTAESIRSSFDEMLKSSNDYAKIVGIEPFKDWEDILDRMTADRYADMFIYEYERATDIDPGYKAALLEVFRNERTRDYYYVNWDRIYRGGLALYKEVTKCLNPQ